MQAKLGEGKTEHFDVPIWKMGDRIGVAIDLVELKMSVIYRDVDTDSAVTKVVFQNLEGIEEGVFPAVSLAGKAPTEEGMRCGYCAVFLSCQYVCWCRVLAVHRR